MTTANPINYQLAAQFVVDGSWRVDLSLGLVYGKRGAAFVRTNSWGYVQIKFREPGNWRQEHAALAHRVIWESAHGPLADDLTVNHLNGNKQDNRLANLEALTLADNVRHAYRTGLNAGHVGTDNPQSQLTDDEALRIYRDAWSGRNQTEIGMEYGVGRSIVSNIKRGWAWTHVTHHRPNAASGQP